MGRGTACVQKTLRPVWERRVLKTHTYGGLKTVEFPGRKRRWDIQKDRETRTKGKASGQYVVVKKRKKEGKGENGNSGKWGEPGARVRKG